MVETTFKGSRAHAFLKDIMDLCRKHNVCLVEDNIEFYQWDVFESINADKNIASMYWPRIQTDVIVEREKV